MFHLVKIVFLLSILSGTANAQWGTVVAQSDTNRFITSQEKLGLIMPHQQVIVGLMDTIITSVGIGGGNAYKVIVGSLLDYEDNCVNYSITNGVATCQGSYELWREMEKSTSWYQADRGDTTAMFPTNYAITISTGQDSINIWNRDTAELWMAFFLASSNKNMIGVTADPVNDIKFVDGILYVGAGDGSESSWAFMIKVDFLIETAIGYFATGMRQFSNNIQGRNKTGTFPDLSSSLAIINNAVNAVAAVRDPFGQMDGLGRPKHWWAVATAGGGSVYNPHTNSIYDEGTPFAWSHTPIGKKGVMVYDQGTGSQEGIRLKRSIFSIAAAYEENYVWYNGGTGAMDIAWTNSAVISGITVTDDLSNVGTNAPIIRAGSDEGLYNIHYFGGMPESGAPSAKQRFSSTVNAPVVFGKSVASLAFEDNTTDSSPEANTWTASGMGTVTAVFGNGGSWTVGAYVNAPYPSSEFNIGATDSFTLSLWLRYSANPGRQQALVVFSGGGETEYLKFYGETDGTVKVSFDDGTSSFDVIDVATVVADDEWHHYAMTRDYPALKYSLYIDGVVAGTVGIVESIGAMDWQECYLGRDEYNADGLLAGVMDDFSMGIGVAASAEAIYKIHAEGRKKLNMGTPSLISGRGCDCLASADIDYVDALDNGIWLAGNEDSLTVFDGRIPLQTFGTSLGTSGTIADAALISNPGADSVGVVMGTTTELIFVQPSVNLRAAMTHQYKEPIYIGESVVVDSAGTAGIFWTAQDAHDAGKNGGVFAIEVVKGTYAALNMNKHSMKLECLGGQGNAYGSQEDKIVFVGGGSAYALSVTSNDNEISGCGFYTAPGGGGGGYDAVNFTAASNYTKFHDNSVYDCDDNCIQTHGPAMIYDNSVFNGDGFGIAIEGTGDQTTVTGNYIIGTASGAGLINGDAENCLVVGNSGNGTWTDYSGTSEVAHNE